MTDMKQRARNAMVGLAIGDAISWTSMFQRSFLLPPWTRRIRREIDTSSEATNVIVTPMPFSLNQPAQHFDISPTMNTEWSAFSAEILVGNGFSSYTQSAAHRQRFIIYEKGFCRLKVGKKIRIISTTVRWLGRYR
ncbi:MAG: hypothetical protein HYV29_01210 [Ignavibacteriales bacterium]|nr:hypothetical protein [Ignavibacteriales bacterium]